MDGLIDSTEMSFPLNCIFTKKKGFVLSFALMSHPDVVVFSV